MELTENDLEQSADSWWEHRRRYFNETLVMCAPISFAGLLLIWLIFGFTLPCRDLTFFVIFFGAIFFIIALPLANLAYTIGPRSERRTDPGDVLAYRRRMYSTGLWFWLFIIFLPILVNAIWLLTGHTLTSLC